MKVTPNFFKMQERGYVKGEHLDFATLYPVEAGRIAHNKLLFLPFSPAKLDIFQGLFNDDIYTLQIPLFFHYVSTDLVEDEGFQRVSYLCKREMTILLQSNLKSSEPFFGIKCSLCEEAQKIVDNYNELRKQKGLWKVKMDRMEYIKKIQADEQLNSLYIQQKKFRPTMRYLYLIFDLDKFEGRKGEVEEVGLEYLLVGKQVKNGIDAQIEAGHRFWDIDEGLKVVVITKDTTEGVSPLGIMHAKYSVAISPDPLKDKNLVDYIRENILSIKSPPLNFWRDDISYQLVADQILIDLGNNGKVNENSISAGKENVIQKGLSTSLNELPKKEILSPSISVKETPSSLPVMEKGTEDIGPKKINLTESASPKAPRFKRIKF